MKTCASFPHFCHQSIGKVTHFASDQMLSFTSCLLPRQIGNFHTTILRYFIKLMALKSVRPSTLKVQATLGVGDVQILRTASEKHNYPNSYSDVYEGG